MSKRKSKPKPEIPPGFILIYEGLAEYYKAKCPFEEEGDPRRMGWGIGRQIVAQYLVEILLKSALEHQGITRNTHNLAYLFKKLPGVQRNAVERRYKEFLNSEVEWTWDVFETVWSFLNYLGKNPIKKTRYPWQSGDENETLFSPNIYLQLIYALFVELHGYPCDKGSFEKKIGTKFKSLADSRKYERLG